MIEATVTDALVALVDVLEASNVDYAVGGAIAMGLVGYPRATADVDVLVAIPAIRTQCLVDALAAAGFTSSEGTPLDARRWLDETRTSGLCRVTWRGVRVELFVPKVPLQHSVLARRWRGAITAAKSAWITTAEDLVLLKMVFNRPKDLIDVQRLLVARHGELDLAYIEDWATRTLAPDAREALGALVATYGAPRR